MEEENWGERRIAMIPPPEPPPAHDAATPLRVAIADRIATITLNRPEVYNAIDRAMAEELASALTRIARDTEVDAVVLTGAGTAFCAGGDLRWVAQQPDGATAAFHRLATFVHVSVAEIRRCARPVIAAVNGAAVGGGFSLALACDFRVMSRTAVLRQGYTSAGLSIDAGGTFALPRLVGFARALEIAALDEPISADRALALHLVTRVAEPENLLAAAVELVRSIRERSLHSFAWSKALLSDSFETPLERQLEREREGITRCAAHPDGVRGVQAFLQKRRG